MDDFLRRTKPGRKRLRGALQGTAFVRRFRGRAAGAPSREVSTAGTANPGLSVEQFQREFMTHHEVRAPRGQAAQPAPGGPAEPSVEEDRRFRHAWEARQMLGPTIAAMTGGDYGAPDDRAPRAPRLALIMGPSADQAAPETLALMRHMVQDGEVDVDAGIVHGVDSTEGNGDVLHLDEGGRAGHFAFSRNHETDG